MSDSTTSPAAPQSWPDHCPICDDVGWLPYPYGESCDYAPCPCCTNSEASWTTDGCLPVRLFEREGGAA